MVEIQFRYVHSARSATLSHLARIYWPWFCVVVPPPLATHLQSKEAKKKKKPSKKRKTLILTLRCASIGPRSIVLFTHKRIGISLFSALQQIEAPDASASDDGLCKSHIQHARESAHIHSHTRAQKRTTSGVLCIQHERRRRASALWFDLAMAKSNRKKAPSCCVWVLLLQRQLRFSSKLRPCQQQQSPS